MVTFNDEHGVPMNREISTLRLGSGIFGMFRFREIISEHEEISAINQSLSTATDKEEQKQFGNADIELLAKESYKDTIWYRHRINFHHPPITIHDTKYENTPGEIELINYTQRLANGLKEYLPFDLDLRFCQGQRQLYYLMDDSSQSELLQLHRDTIHIGRGGFNVIQVGQSSELR
eukprot:131146_1